MSEEPGYGDARAALMAAIEAELGELGPGELRGAASALSECYRSGRPSAGRSLRSTEAQAYLATRVPATFATTRRVLAELASLHPGWAPASMLDLGAGPGTATWAALDVFGTIERAVLVERDREMTALGERLAGNGLSRLFGELAWTRGDVCALDLPGSDLVVAAYVLGEISGGLELPALERWWRATRGHLALVEPGTPAGFERLRAARSALISWGARVGAPCPHDQTCPMVGSDWCHFAVRLERSALHRDLKAARLGYEDEKYSYLVVSPSPPSAPAARLVRSPRPHRGHVRLVLCETDGLTERVISRRDGELYRRARDARWGDRLELDSNT
ncbi:MAG: small ribosomal subunit Rsm22 family protein [Acidimicrobiales bacterium]